MKIFTYKIILTHLFLIIVFNGYSQDSKSILLNRSIHPIYSWNKELNHMVDSVESNPTYLAGDYSDGNTQFTVAIDKEDDIVTKPLHVYSLYVNSYKSDSIYVGGGIGINQSAIIDNVPIIIKVGKKEFSAKVNLDNNSVLISQLTKYFEPDVELINNNLPDVSFSLLYGGKSSFKYYEHKSPYIYLEFLGTWCRGCYQAMDDMKELNTKYNDKVTIISIAFNEPASSHQTVDTNDIKKVVELHQVDWVQGVADKYIRRLFYLSSAPYGVLYDSDGNLIKSGMHPKSLLKFLDEKYH
ncbi:MAG TPA: thioredoxin family protein [Bacteroidia bacterium]|jgi:thiol-disulfide isomerase/thioredoxin|nr:thioredoxin family protein [Bacteroidia bacterium]